MSVQVGVLSCELIIMMLRECSATGVLGRENGFELTNQVAAMSWFIFIYHGSLFYNNITV